MFIDGRVNIEGFAPIDEDQVRRVAIRLIASGIDRDTPITDTDRAWARDVAEALGLLQPRGGMYRDAITRAWKKRPVTTQPLAPDWTCEGQTSIEELIPDDDTEDEGEKWPCPDC